MNIKRCAKTKYFPIRVTAATRLSRALYRKDVDRPDIIPQTYTANHRNVFRTNCSLQGKLNQAVGRKLVIANTSIRILDPRRRTVPDQKTFPPCANFVLQILCWFLAPKPPTAPKSLFPAYEAVDSLLRQYGDFTLMLMRPTFLCVLIHCSPWSVDLMNVQALLHSIT